MQNINLINALAEHTRRENERRRKEKVVRIKQQHQRRREAAEVANAQARVEAQQALREEVKRAFMRNPWATEADFNEAWKKDKLTMIREYQQSLHTMQRM